LTILASDAGISLVRDAASYPLPKDLSSLSGNHMEECRAVLASLAEAGVEGVPVVIGGTIPPSDEPALAEMGISAVFGSGSPLRTIVGRIAELLED